MADSALRDQQSHFDRQLYARYHRDVYLPDHVRAGAVAFLPPPGTPLGLTRHYEDIQHGRNLPSELHMPHTYEVVDVTVIRQTWAVFRVLIRTPWYWGKGRRARHDLVLALEGDYDCVTAFWIRREDQHETLDRGAYEQPP